LRVECDGKKDGFHGIVVSLIRRRRRVAARSREEAVEMWPVLSSQRAPELFPVVCGLLNQDGAVSILSYRRTQRGNGDVINFLKQRIDSMLAKRKDAPDPTFSSEYASGRRHYQVRVFALKCNLENHAGPTLAVLLERKREHPDLLHAARKFHLTEREKEGLELLMQEYTTGQIASGMDISPNHCEGLLAVGYVQDPSL
jgi:hypothetical protein